MIPLVCLTQISLLVRMQARTHLQLDKLLNIAPFGVLLESIGRHMKRLKKTDTKLAKTLGPLADKTAKLEIALKGKEDKQQAFYNMGFANAIGSIKVVVKEASLGNFTNCWVAAFDAFLIPTSSTLRCLENIPYPVHLLESPEDATAQPLGLGWKLY